MPEHKQDEQQPKQKREYKLTKVKPSKREDIIQAAIRVMCHFGYDATTMDKIAVEAGVSRTLVIRYFSTKDKIAGICIQRICENIIMKVRKISDTSKTYREQTDRMFSFVQSSQSELRLIISLFATPALEHVIHSAMPELTKHMQHLVLKHNSELQDKDAAALSYTMTALYFHYILTHRSDLFENARDNVLQRYLNEK